MSFIYPLTSLIALNIMNTLVKSMERLWLKVATAANR